MVERTYAYQQWVGPYAVGGGLGQIGHLQRVLECARGGFGQLAQQLHVGVAQLHERGIGEEAEQLLEHVHQLERGQQQQRIHQKP